MTDTIETRPLTASERGDQDEQVWRAERIKARFAAEQRAQPQPRVTEMWAAARRAG